VTGGDQQEALAALRLTWVARSHDVWKSEEEHVPQLHREVADRVVREASRAQSEDPPGVVIEGEAGTGKTHLLGWVRERVQQEGGYFFLIALAHGETFWESAVESVLDGLGRPHAGSDATQLQVLLTGLGKRAGVSRTLQPLIEGRPPTRNTLDRFVGSLGTQAGLRPELRDPTRALGLYSAQDPDLQDLARAYFLGDDLQPGRRAELGLGAPRAPERTLRHLSQALALTGHSVIAVDQLDPLVYSAAASVATVHSSRPDAGRDRLVNQVAQGLMGLQEGTERTLTVLTCIPNSWTLIKQRSGAGVADRFQSAGLSLGTIGSRDVARVIVEQKLGARYRELGFTPPYPSWPVAPSAFATAEQCTPRYLLQRIDAHARACLESGQIAELSSFEEPTAAVRMGENGKVEDPPEFAELDARYQQLRATADADGAAHDHTREDQAMPLLLQAGLRAWIAERGTAAKDYELDPPPSSAPPLHAGLRRILDETFEAQELWAFRAIASPNALATQHRLRRALLQSGIDVGDDLRKLFILRKADWPRGPKTQALVEEFTSRGGVKLDVDVDDLRTFAALRILFTEQHPALPTWLVARQPAGNTKLLRQALPPEERNRSGGGTHPETQPAGEGPVEDGFAGDEPVEGGPAGEGPAGEGPAEDGSAEARRPDTPSISVGSIGSARVWIELESLRKHVAVFAGSGSGKTVLLRRLIEECAMEGVSSIVLDPNNDLARLGDSWPEPPRGWREGDAQRAADYLTQTDVTVWTPRWEGGRPLTFQPLPDFASVLDDPDEFQQAVDLAVSALVPRAGAAGRTTKAERQRAVLRQAVDHFAQGGGGSLTDFLEVLGDLPADASTLRTAPAMAADMAQTLTAAMVNDPLFGGQGAPVDPGLLLAPAGGRRARVSVISFVGLADEAQRQGFVGQLQMALFAWFKRNPAGDRPLGGLLVMDEAQTLAPSGAMTASTESTLVLASQARKYGLGLVFATQAPKGLHNRIPGNAATQFFGYLNSPSQIATARDIARAKGGDVSDISKLRSGEFYVAGEGARFQRIKTFNCLSHHPRSPLSNDEVIARARNTPPGR
jgi:hypothetical protein